MLENLLIAMDMSPASIAMLRAVEKLRAAGAEKATLVHVMNARDAGGRHISLRNVVEPLLEEKRRELEAMGFRTRAEILLGEPAFEINRFAVEMDSSLIVAGTHGESLAKGLLMGSVVHRLLKLAEKPVLLIPITFVEGEGEGAKCEVRCADFFRHPLFATDFSDPAGNAFHYLEYIVGYAHPPETTLYHVQDEARISQYLAPRLEEFDRIDMGRLAGMEERLKSLGAARVHKKVEFGRPGPLILEKIRKGGHSILVIASQGRGYMADAILGRVAHHVVHRSTIPVLVVPGKR